MPISSVEQPTGAAAQAIDSADTPADPSAVSFGPSRRALLLQGGGAAATLC
ncbi:hypothetical protein TMEC50S_01286 [Thauera mechernichensis]